MKAKKPFLLRLDPALYGALEEWAAQELRSVNGQIEYILRSAVARRRRPERPGEPGPPARGNSSGGEE